MSRTNSMMSREFSRCRPAGLLLLALAEDLEQLDEEVDDVEVERCRREDVLFRRDLLHDHVHVVDDVQREDDCAGARQTDVHQSILQPYLQPHPHDTDSSQGIF